MEQIILASASPRRKELLEQIGISFEICPAKGEERITKSVPHEVVELGLPTDNTQDDALSVSLREMAEGLESDD